MAITNSSIGSRIRQLRKQRGLALTEVATRAGYTKGFLSKIECAKASPPIATLLRLASALQVEPSQLFQPDAPPPGASDGAVLVRPNQRTKIANAGAGPGYTFMALAAQRGNKRMEPFLLTVNPGEVDPHRTFEHPGDEFIYVLTGEMDYRVGDQLFPMQPGDSLYFDGASPHAPLPRNGPVTFLAVFTAPQRQAKSDNAKRKAKRPSVK